MQSSDSSLVKIRFTMTQELQDSLKNVINTISTFHCAHSFVKDCIDSYEKRKNVYRDFGEEMQEGFLSTRPYFLSQDQANFFSLMKQMNYFKIHFSKKNFLPR